MMKISGYPEPQTPAPFGLLLDVDGPIANPVTRRLDAPGLAQLLSQLADHRIPVIFNTGRAHDFVNMQVVRPMLAGGLRCPWNVFAILEKGAVWARADFRGLGIPTVDEALTTPEALSEQVRLLVERRYSGTMFLDEGKDAMISVEQRTDVSTAEYLGAQQQLLDDLDDLLSECGIAATRLDTAEELGAGTESARQEPSERQRLDIDPTIISVDIQVAGTGKALGAQRALRLLADDHIPTPQRWITYGDSVTDYAMADWVHAHGMEVTHVDVRPVDSAPTPPYRVLTYPDVQNDLAALRSLRHLAATLSN
ncbi:MAG: hypothetical protein LKF88_05115 [Microbacteriaceae bacterium]|jgi:hydroxymethylpyrimidine pyrophosphatase-like HAD family hydrolase|nr:hypothetical protein [Microbacteriaceae bacterium]MCI1207468.1 hypothetical protein [Microbacteriaceae bacterium]